VQQCAAGPLELFLRADGLPAQEVVESGILPEASDYFEDGAALGLLAVEVEVLAGAQVALSVVEALQVVLDAGELLQVVLEQLGVLLAVRLEGDYLEALDALVVSDELHHLVLLVAHRYQELPRGLLPTGHSIRRLHLDLGLIQQLTVTPESTFKLD
jgi:hypothetical protein